MPGIKFRHNSQLVQQSADKRNLYADAGNSDLGVRLHPDFVKRRGQIIFSGPLPKTSKSRRIQISLFPRAAKNPDWRTQIFNLRQSQPRKANVADKRLHFRIKRRQINGLGQVVKRQCRYVGEFRKQVVAAHFRIALVEVDKQNRLVRHVRDNACFLPQHAQNKHQQHNKQQTEQRKGINHRLHQQPRGQRSLPAGSRGRKRRFNLIHVPLSHKKKPLTQTVNGF